MLLRVLPVFIVLLTCTSCDFFKLEKVQLEDVETNIDFSSVDAPPTFENCVDLIDKSAKTACFRKTMHAYIASSLQKNIVQVAVPIEAQITVAVMITISGKVSVQHIDASDHLKKAMPSLDSLMRASVAQVPRVFPALKRGIPVATQYQIPIEIRVNKK